MTTTSTTTPNITLRAISVGELSAMQSSRQAFTLLDVRRASARAQTPQQIAGAVWLDPALWLDWKDNVRKDRPVVVYCAKGHEIGQAMCATLNGLGLDAQFLEGGLVDWMAQGQTTAALEPNE